MRTRLAAILLLIAAACAPTDPLLPDDIPHQVQVAPWGIQPSGSDLRIDFGRSRDGVVAAVTRLIGAPPEAQAVNEDCGAGPMEIVSWPGLDLLFMDRSFRGWVADDAVFITTNGYSAGMTRAQLEAAGITGFRETSLGVEFEAGGIYGLLEGPGAAARVSHIWAGVSCFFR